jgi:hypothetical protein
MSLAIRMVLYAMFSALATTGLVDFNADTGDVSFSLMSIELILTGAIGYVATFAASRFAKVK